MANQKGGVGKSTTAVNLGAALAELGQRVLVVDLDPQGNASTGMGIDPGRRALSTYQILASEVAASEAVLETAVPGLWAIPASIDLAGAEIELVSQFSREMRLRRAVEELSTSYDFIFLDCPPSLGLLTVNALSAAGELMVPIQCEYYALEGLGQLLRNVRLVQQNLNPSLRLSGIVLTMFDPRTRLSEQVVEEVRRYFGSRVYESVIPRTVRLSEAPGFGMPITQYDPRSKGAGAYRALAREVLERPVSGDPLPVAEPPRVVISEPAPAEEEDELVGSGEALEGAVAGSHGPEMTEEQPDESTLGEEGQAEPPTPGEMVAPPDVREGEGLGGSAEPDLDPSETSEPGEEEPDEEQEDRAPGGPGAGDGGGEQEGPRRRWGMFGRRQGGEGR